MAERYVRACGVSVRLLLIRKATDIETGSRYPFRVAVIHIYHFSDGEEWPDDLEEYKCHLRRLSSLSNVKRIGECLVMPYGLDDVSRFSQPMPTLRAAKIAGMRPLGPWGWVSTPDESVLAPAIDIAIKHLV
jgi:hypothetical protein